MEFDRTPLTAAPYGQREPDEERGDREEREDHHPEVAGLLRTWHPSLKMTSEQGGPSTRGRSSTMLEPFSV